MLFFNANGRSSAFQLREKKVLRVHMAPWPRKQGWRLVANTLSSTPTTQHTVTSVKYFASVLGKAI